MRKFFIITVAGISSRFRESIKYDTLKCLFTISGENCILDRMIELASQNQFDNIIIVGGYRYLELTEHLKKRNFEKVEIRVIYNEKYETLGSNYSLYLGLCEALKYNDIEKIVFAEGDLIFDGETLSKINLSKKDVITTNNNPINALSSVIFYTNLQNEIKYYFDPNHGYFHLKEPFIRIFNSGQVWSLTDTKKLDFILANQREKDFEDNNLNIINKYLNNKLLSDIDILNFQRWHNCNTISDYQQAIEGLT